MTGTSTATPVRRLWVAATSAELACAPLGTSALGASLPVADRDEGLITGCGPLAGATLAAFLARHAVREVVGIGIAGAFPGSSCRVGEAYLIRSERPCGWGAEAGCGDEILELPFPGLAPEILMLSRPPDLAHLVMADSCTVALATGTAETAMSRRSLGVDLENMEGFAWAVAARAASVPFAQVRAVSNVAGPRDRSSWKIAPALDALARALASEDRS